WKVARTGVEPLRELAAAKEARDARECFYVALGELTENARRYTDRNGIRIVAGPELARLLPDARRDGPQRGQSAQRRGSASAHPEIGLADVVVLRHLDARPLAPHPAVLEHVHTIGDAQRRLRVLLRHEDRGAVLADLADRLEDLHLQAMRDPD